MDFLDNLNLPEGGDTHDLEQLSRDKLIPLLHDYLFLVRDEFVRDYGVDMSIELRLANKAPTNIRFHAQLKAIDKKELKAERSFGYSIQINTANVNYLLNSPKSIYFLYIKSKDTFYYAWADELFLSLHEKDKDWAFKNSDPSIRFEKRLDKNGLEEIYKKVREHGKMLRTLHEQLLITVNALSSNIIVSAEDLSITSDESICTTLKKKGWDLINNGKSKEIIQITENATRKIQKDSKVSLILAYAHYNVGEFFQALQLLRKAKQDLTGLTEFEIDYLHFLNIALKKSYGLVSDEISIIEFNKLKSRNKYFNYFIQLEELKAFFISNPEKNYELALVELNKIKNQAQQFENITLQAECQLLLCQGWMLKHQYLVAVAEINVQEKVSNKIETISRQEVSTILQNKWNEWEIQINELNKKIDCCPNPVLKGIFYYTYVYCKARKEIIYQLVNYRKAPEKRAALSKKETQNYLSLLQKASVIHRNANHYYNLCVNLIAEHEILVYVEENELAKEKLDELITFTTIYEFPGLLENVNNIKNETYFQGIVNIQKSIDRDIKREEEASKLMIKVHSLENKISPSITRSQFSKNVMIIDISHSGYYVVFPNQLDDFCRVFNSKNHQLLKNELLLSHLRNQMPIINPAYESVKELGHLEGRQAVKKMDDLVRIAERHEQLFKLGVYNLKVYK